MMDTGPSIASALGSVGARNETFVPKVLVLGSGADKTTVRAT